VTSARLYADNSRYSSTPSYDRRPVIEAATDVTVFGKDIPPQLRHGLAGGVREPASRQAPADVLPG
jgi:hypothetical protein